MCVYALRNRCTWYSPPSSPHHPHPTIITTSQLKGVGEVLREVGSPEGCGGWTATTDADLDTLLQRMTDYVDAMGTAAMTVLRRRRAAGMLCG